MAIVYNKNNEENPLERISDSSGFFKTLNWPAGISLQERNELYKSGKEDARGGKKACVNNYNEFFSPRCEALIHSANSRIAIEWKNCNNECFAIRKNISLKLNEIENLKSQIKKLNESKHKDLYNIQFFHYDGDDVVSEHLAKRRQEIRKKRIEDKYNDEIEQLENRLTEMELEIIPEQVKFTEIEESTKSNEQLIRSDFLWKLSVYAYGASNYIKISPDMINDNYLTSEPQDNHEILFQSIKRNFIESANLDDGSESDNNSNNENNSQSDSEPGNENGRG